MKMKKIKIKVDGKIIAATVEKDLHYLGGKKVIYVLPINRNINNIHFIETKQLEIPYTKP